MTFGKINGLINTGTKWKDNNQLFSLIYQKQNLNIEDLDNDIFDSQSDKCKSSDHQNFDFNEMDIDDEKPKINSILFKQVFKLYDQLIIEDYLTDVHTVFNIIYLQYNKLE